MINRQIVLSELPGLRSLSGIFRGREVRCPVPADGELLLRVLYIPLDAASRAWMQGATYRPRPRGRGGDGGVGTGRGGGIVPASFRPGDLVCAETGWQTFAVVPAAGLIRLPRLEPLTHLLSVYGVAGLTAYFGLLECVRPVRANAGRCQPPPVPSALSSEQIARDQGRRTVGICGRRQQMRLAGS
ncbi:hypothetical protein ACPA9J_13145 [Pseudomonas aeruginosa]